MLQDLRRDYMTANLFREYASNENNVDWKNHIEREIPLYQRKNDIRSEYERDSHVYYIHLHTED